MFQIEKWILVLVVILALMLPFAALAQDTPTEPAPTEEVVTPTVEPIIVEPPPPDPVTEEPGDPPATSPENLLGQLFALLKDATFIAWAAAGTVVIVGLIKVIASAAGVAITGNSAIAVTLVVQVIIWLTYSIANYFGQGEAFKTWFLYLADVARSLLPLAGAIFAGHVLYQQAAKRNVPILGYSKKTAATPTAA